MKLPADIGWHPTGKTLGQGGQGSVQQVSRQIGGKTVFGALKTLRNVDSTQAYDRFVREVDATCLVDNPLVINILDHSKPGDEFHFYVMEYHEGAVTLGKTIHNGDNPFHENALAAVSLFEQLLGVIEACDQVEPKIVHRDIKPENILCLPDGTIRLIDFGICHFEEGETITLVDEDVGPRNYCAPECESGIVGRVGIHTDLYSAGKVLWSAVTSRRAFAREEAAFAGLSMKKLFPLKHELWHLVNIFRNTIRKNPADRWSNIAEAKRIVVGVRHLVQNGYLPVELSATMCMRCGWGTLYKYENAHQIFGNPAPRNVDAVRCDHCGALSVKDRDVLNKTLQEREGLV